MPAIARECCAFLGELVLLEHLKSDNPALYDQASAVWNRESARYLGADFQQLKLAFRGQIGLQHENYRWNYPIARYLAIEHWENHRDSVQQLFAAGNNTELFYLPINHAIEECQRDEEPTVAVA